MFRRIKSRFLIFVGVFSLLFLNAKYSYAACGGGTGEVWINQESYVARGNSCSPPNGFPGPVTIGNYDQKPCSDGGDIKNTISPDNKVHLCCCHPDDPLTPKIEEYLLPPEAFLTALGLVAATPGGIILDAVSLIMGVIGGIVLLLLISGGFKYATSHGSPDGIMDAKNTITAALTGLAVIVFAVLILGTLGVNVFGLPGFSWAGKTLTTPSP